MLDKTRKAILTGLDNIRDAIHADGKTSCDDRHAVRATVFIGHSSCNVVEDSDAHNLTTAIAQAHARIDTFHRSGHPQGSSIALTITPANSR